MVKRSDLEARIAESVPARDPAEIEQERAMLLQMLDDARATVRRLEGELSLLERGAEPGEDEVHPVVLWRRRRGLSQADLAAAIGISAPGLWRIEHTPGLACRNDTALKLAGVLDVPLEALVWEAKA